MPSIFSAPRRHLFLFGALLCFAACGSDEPEEQAPPAPLPPTILAPDVVTAHSSGVVASIEAPQKGITYTWTIDGGTFTSDEVGVEVTFDAGAGPELTLDVRASNARGQTETVSRTVDVVPGSDATIQVVAGLVTEGAEGLEASVPAQPGATFEWTVSGGAITAGQGTESIVFSAGAPGTLELAVVVTNAAGASVQGEAEVEVVAIPDATIQAHPYVTSGRTGVASVPAKRGSTYEWTFTGGSIASGQGSDTLTYEAGPGASVELAVTVTNAAGAEASDATSIEVVALPDPTIDMVDLPLSAGKQYTASVADQPGVTYEWAVVGGTIVEGQDDLEVTFEAGAPGNLTISATVTNLAGDSSTDRREIEIYPYPDATMTVPQGVTVFIPATASVPPQPGLTFTWEIQGGTILSGAGTETVTFYAYEWGRIVLNLTVSSPSHDTESSRIEVSVHLPPLATITTVAGPVATGRSGLVATVPNQPGLSIDWTVTGGTIEAGQGTSQLTFTAGGPGSLGIEVLVSNAVGATATDAATLQVLAEPEVAFSLPATAFPGELLSASIPAQVGATYQWTVTGGTIVGGQGTHSLLVETGAPGTLQVEATVTSAASVVGTSAATVSIYTAADATITAPATVRVGSPATASVPEQLGAGITWTVQNGTILSQAGHQLTFVANAHGTVTLEAHVQGGNGDVASDLFELEGVAAGDATIATQETIHTGKTYTASVPHLPGQSYAWVIAGGRIVSGADTAEITYTAELPGSLSLSVIVMNALGDTESGSASVEVIFGAFRPTGSLSWTRVGAKAVTLQDGRALVIGGGPFPSVDAFDPVSETFTAIQPMAEARRSHSATVLQDGRVLVVGGNGPSGTLASAELFDPVTDTWRMTASMPAALFWHRATLLSDGRVLVVGDTTAAIYDPAAESWTQMPNLLHRRDSHAAALLPDGRVLVAGGWSGQNPAPGGEIFDPATESWSFVGGIVPTYYGTAVRLGSGEILLAGGYEVRDHATVTSQSFSPMLGYAALTAPMLEARALQGTAVLSNGWVLQVGGTDSGYHPGQGGGLAHHNKSLASAEVYDPSSRTYHPTTDLGTSRSNAAVTVLLDGRVLVAGGVETVVLPDGSVIFVNLATAELFEY